MENKKKRSEKELLLYENKILSYIIMNAGKCGIKEVAEVFNINKTRIYELIKKYSLTGFDIISRKKYFIINKYPSNFKVLRNGINKHDLKKFIIYNAIKDMEEKNQQVLKQTFITNFSNNHNTIVDSQLYLNKLIHELMAEGYIYQENGRLNTIKNPFGSMNKKELLKLLIYFNIMKNAYPKMLNLHDVFSNMLLYYEAQGKDFNHEAIIYPHKHRISAYDELLLNVIEEMAISRENVNVMYKTKKGVQKLNVIIKGIIYSGFKDMWYIVCENNGDMVLRLDRIININSDKRIINNKEEVFFYRDLYEISFAVSHEDIVNVKVQFEKENFIYKKLIGYKKIRTSAIIREEDKYFVLEDKVCGINEFAKWVRSFGKSAECIEPEKLRNKIKDDISVMKERYGADAQYLD